MKIHAYRIRPRGEVGLTQVLQDIRGLGLADRLKNVSGVLLRLEHCEQQGPYWLLDFNWIQREGPGRASPDEPVSDFDLEENEGFCAETAALFHPESEFLLLQYNHYGPRTRRIQHYLYRHALRMADLNVEEEQHAERHGFDFHPLLHGDAADQLDRAGLVKRIAVTVHIPGVRARPEARRRSLGGLLDMPLMGAAESLHFEVSASRKKSSSLSLSRVKRTIDDLLGSRDDVSQLTVVVKENEDAPQRPLDLLKARVEADVSVRLEGRRYPRDERLRALRSTFEAWRDERML